MNKDEYFKVSDALNLPKRCPILEKCSRRAWSIYLLGYYDVSKSNNPINFLIKEGILNEDFETNNIPVQGESPTFIGGANNSYFHDVCPEVNLFDKNNAIFYAKEKACISASWDKYNKEPKEKIIECRHYSECPEFSKYQYGNSLSIKLDQINQVEGIKDNLVKDEIITALEKTRKLSQELNFLEHERTCVLLLNRFKDISTKSINETEHPMTIRIEKNKIVTGILLILNEIKAHK